MNLFESPGFLINQLAHLMSVELDRRLSNHGVSTSQWAILAILWNKGGLSQFELQKNIGVRGATMTGLLNRMSKLGLILRRRDETDQRIQRIYLTEKARSLESRLWLEAQEVNEKAFVNFSEEEKDFLIRLILRVIKNFQ